MGSSLSSKAGAAGGRGLFGECWTSQIYFDPESDKSSGDIYNINDEDLRERLGQLIDTNEEILNIWICSEPLYSLQPLIQPVELILYHAFVILETDQYFWSIEKNDEGITIQRSHKLTFVKDFYRRKRRNTPISERSKDTGRMRMENLIDWLYLKNELNKPYNISRQHSNCQGFAIRIFDHFARYKRVSSAAMIFDAPKFRSA